MNNDVDEVNEILLSKHTAKTVVKKHKKNNSKI